MAIGIVTATMAALLSCAGPPSTQAITKGFGQETKTAGNEGSPITKTLLPIEQPRRATIHDWATASSTAGIFAKRSRTVTTLTVMTRAISVATIAPDILTVTPCNETRRGRNWDGYGNFGGSNQLRQTALNAGYNEGMKQGQKDRNKRNNYGFQGQ